MQTNFVNLEAKVFYRLVKVVYIFFLGVFFLLVFFWGWQEKPYQIIDVKKSYLICPDSTKYSFDKLNIFSQKSRKYYSSYDIKEVIKACSTNENNQKNFIKIKLSSDEVFAFPESMDDDQIKLEIYKNHPEYLDKIEDLESRSAIQQKLSTLKKLNWDEGIDWSASYPTHWEYETVGTWFKVIKFWFFGFIIIFLTLNGIKQSVLYIVYGKRFTFFSKKFDNSEKAFIKQQSISTLKSEVPLTPFPNVRPWVRLIARSIDIYVFATVFVMFWEISSPSSVPKSEIGLGMVVLFAWIFAESALLSLWGTTFGKWLLKVKVRDNEGKKLTLPVAMKRSFFVWLYGLGIGMPIFSVFTKISAYRDLTKKGITTWDKDCHLIVVHQKIGVIRVAVATLIIGLFMVMIICDRIA